jgi:predicted amidohydrolase YtcJ
VDLSLPSRSVEHGRAQNRRRELGEAGLHDPDLFAAFHRAGLTVHVHCNGDEATGLFVDTVESTLTAFPRWNHRHTVTYSQLTTAAQYRRMSALGMCANIFSNHLWYWEDQHRDLSSVRIARVA